jgi:Zn-dependent protease with chaperone function
VSEAAFPLLGAAFVILVVLPCCAALARLSLAFVERGGGVGPLHGLAARYLLITGSTFLPLAWFFSAGLHQVESGRSALACLLDHGAAKLCLEPGFFALALSLVALARSAPVLRGARGLSAAQGAAAHALLARVDRILARHPELAGLTGRVVATESAGFALGTQGWLRPRVFVGMVFATRLTDEMLAAALGHELEHVRLRDPLRFRVLALALALNPIGRRLLDPHAARWLSAREAHCDREAVLRGSLPLPLADAIVRAARPGSSEMAALGARDTAMLKLRIGMLIAFAERAPHRCCRREPPSFPLALTLLLLALLLPHRAGTGALDALHTGAEQAFAVLLP